MTTVNHWGKWINSDDPTTGVVSMNNLEWINDELYYSDAFDLSYESALEEYLLEKLGEWQNDQDDLNAMPDFELMEEWRQDFNDHYDNLGESEYLIGNWIKAEDGKYDPDTTGEYAAIALCGSNVVQVVWSKYATRCALCSPCYPGQGDLDSIGEFLAYDLPIEIYGEFRENTNAQIELTLAT